MKTAALVIVVALGLVPAVLRSASPEAPAKAKTKAKGGKPGEGEAVEGEDKRSNHFKSFTKVRQGSFLRQAEPEPPAPDLRGEIERRRDWEVVAHFKRLAEIDVIAEIAAHTEDAALADRAEAVRRLEIERFRLAMRRLRTVIQARALQGTAP